MIWKQAAGFATGTRGMLLDRQSLFFYHVIGHSHAVRYFKHTPHSLPVSFSSCLSHSFSHSLHMPPHQQGERAVEHFRDDLEEDGRAASGPDRGERGKLTANMKHFSVCVSLSLPPLSLLQSCTQRNKQAPPPQQLRN